MTIEAAIRALLPGREAKLFVRVRDADIRLNDAVKGNGVILDGRVNCAIGITGLHKQRYLSTRTSTQ